MTDLQQLLRKYSNWYLQMPILCMAHACVAMVTTWWGKKSASVCRIAPGSEAVQGVNLCPPPPLQNWAPSSSLTGSSRASATHVAMSLPEYPSMRETNRSQSDSLRWAGVSAMCNSSRWRRAFLCGVDKRYVGSGLFAIYLYQYVALATSASNMQW